MKGSCPECGSELELTFGATAVTDPTIDPLEVVGSPMIVCTSEECDFAKFLKEAE